MNTKYTNEDFQYATPPRVMGSETEYTTVYVPDENNLARYVPRNLINASQQDISFNGEVWLRNGGRLYVDYGELLEYATPECLSAGAVADHERAGEYLVQGIARGVVDEYVVDSAKPSVYKRSGYSTVYGPDGNLLLSAMSAGHHENYYTPLCSDDSGDQRSELSEIAQRGLHSYLATRPVWSGAGLVTIGGYKLSQKADGLDFYGTDPTTHGSKRPLDIHYLNRLEIRTGEGNMSPWALKTKFAMTSLVLRLLEHGDFPKELCLLPKTETYVMRQQAFWRWEASPTVLTAAKHQRAIGQAALALADRYRDTVPKEETIAAEEVIRTCDQIIDSDNDTAGIAEALAPTVDWAAKYHHMLRKGLLPKDISAENLTAVMHDLQWEDISEDGISRRWYRSQKQDDRANRTERYRRLTMPPATRAMLRSNLAERYGEDVAAIDWHTVTMQDGGEYSLHDPYETRWI